MNARGDVAVSVHEEADHVFDVFHPLGPGDESKIEERAGDAGDLPVDDCDHHLLHPAVDPGVDLLHQAEIDKDEPRSRLDEEVSRMGIPVEEAVLQDLLHIRFDQEGGDRLGVDPGPADLLGPTDLDPLHEFEREDAAGGVIPEDLRNDDARITCEVFMKLLRLPGLDKIVELLVHDLGELRIENVEPDIGHHLLQDPDDPADGAEINLDDLLDLGVLHLTATRIPSSRRVAS